MGTGIHRGGQFTVGFGVDGAVTDGFECRVGVADLQEDEFSLGIGVADPHEDEIAVAMGVSDVDGVENTVDGFSISFGVGEEIGYAGVPRLRTPFSLSLGQEVQRRGEQLPVEE